MPFDAVADLEGVGLALLGWCRHLGAQIADKIGGRGGIVRIDPDQYAVKRRTRVDGRKRSLAVRVKARWRVRRDHIVEGAATLRLLVGQCGNNKAYCTDHNCEHRRADRHCPSSHQLVLLVEQDRPQILIEIMAGADPRHNKFIIAPAPPAPGRERLYVWRSTRGVRRITGSASVASWPISNRPSQAAEAASAPAIPPSLARNTNDDRCLHEW